MKNIRIISLLLCFLILVRLVPCTHAAPDDEQGSVAGCYGLDATAPYLGYGQIVENSQAVFLYERNSDTLMYTQNPDAKIYPSSLVKILTAYLATEKGDLDALVTVQEEMIADIPYDAVSAELLPGEQLTLRNLLYCMMSGSANDAASVIAAHISGSEGAFVEEMNQFASSIGCSNTQFRNPHGLHDEEQFSTVRDIAKIVSKAVESEAFCTFFSTTKYTVPATNLSEARELDSKNFLMSQDSVEIYYDQRVTGGRTGIGNDGKRCMATTAQKDGMELICILMGAESTYAEDGRTLVYGGFKETTTLYDAVFDTYKVASVIYEGQPMKQVPVQKGENELVIGAQSSTNAILPKNVSYGDLAFRYSNSYDMLEAPVAVGDLVSGVEIWYGNMCIAYSDLYAMNDVRSVSAALVTDSTERNDSAKNEDGGSVWKLIIVIVSFFAVVAILIYAFRLYVKRKKSDRRETKRRHGRRRREDA